MALPPRFEMVLADVDAGSNTPSLVGKVTEWKKSKPEWGASSGVTLTCYVFSVLTISVFSLLAKQLYRILASANQTLADTLFSLTLAYGQDPGAYDEAVELAASKKSKEVSLARALSMLRSYARPRAPVGCSGERKAIFGTQAPHRDSQRHAVCSRWYARTGETGRRAR